MFLSPLQSQWRHEALRTNLWVVPMVEVVAAVALYVATHAIDRAGYHHRLWLPSWIVFGSADAARQILTALAAAVITVVGVVFSITIVTLTLASTQFGPRMLRNFIRDRGTQFTLGTFVATFVYATLVLISIGPGAHGRAFVPYLSVTCAVGLVALSWALLGLFLHGDDDDLLGPGQERHRRRKRARGLRGRLPGAGNPLEIRRRCRGGGNHDGPAAFEQHRQIIAAPAQLSRQAPLRRRQNVGNVALLQGEQPRHGGILLQQRARAGRA